MGYWGKVIGGMAGFAMGGPFGAVVGAALGHAADQGAVPTLRDLPQSVLGGFRNGVGGLGTGPLGPARIAALLGRREQLFAIAVVVLAAKLAKCDGPVQRTEIDAFKRSFRIPPESLRDVARLFDEARDSRESFQTYADELGNAFADNRGVLEDVLGALFAIARSDGAVNGREIEFLHRVHRGFGLDPQSWERVNSGRSRFSQANEEDPYAVLGVTREMTDDMLRAAWKQLMRENHPDSLAARGVPAEFIERASEKVARINAAWDRIKRDRGI